MPKPLVAIVGRPNVGKSTLFNRLAGAPIAIVEDLPGTTRDRLYADLEWNNKEFTLVDTGGMELTPSGDISSRVQEQAQLSIQEADIVLFVVDGKVGLTSIDLDIADVLRESNKPLIVVAAKADNEQRRLESLQFYELGLGEVVPVSAMQGTGTGDLLDLIVEDLPEEETLADELEAIKVAIIGRPNVGKSSLVNTLLGEERVIVSDIPGTTRDAIDTLLEREGQRIVLIDTAGVRRRGRIAGGIEKYSVLRSLRAIDRSDVCLLLIDAGEGPTAQDAHLAGYIVEALKGIVVVVNKWDLVKGTGVSITDYSKRVRAELRFAPYAPVVFVSAKTRLRVGQVIPAVMRVSQERAKRVPTSQLNDVVHRAIETHNPPSRKGRALRVYYASQVDIEPPKIVVFVNDASLVHFSFQRFLENRLREAFGFEGVPINLSFRNRGVSKERPK